MSLASLHQFFVLYLWFGLVALLLFWGLIARFYQRFSNVKTYYLAFIAPALLVGAVAVRSASAPFQTSADVNDALLGAGGIIFLMITIHLYRHMMRSR